MGVYTSCFLGVGFRLTPPPRQNVMTPSCDHPEAPGNSFCPVCGVQVKMISRSVQNERFGEFIEALLEGEIDLPTGWDIEHLDPMSGDVGHFVGYTLKGGHEHPLKITSEDLKVLTEFNDPLVQSEYQTNLTAIFEGYEDLLPVAELGIYYGIVYS